MAPTFHNWEVGSLFIRKHATKQIVRLYCRCMPWSLERFHKTGALHFITWSCRDRQPLLATPARRDLMLRVLEQMRNRYRFGVVGFVIMPEHVHLLISEPEIRTVSSAISAIKLGFTRRMFSKDKPGEERPGAPLLAGVARSGGSSNHHFWMKRYYDFNVFSSRKIAEKLHYMHENPVVRGLVERPEDWKWSSFRFYACGESGIV
jgi:putative transposase